MLNLIYILDCKTEDGRLCVFPFKYNGATYTKCTTVDGGGKYWCATAVNSNGGYIGYGYCGLTPGNHCNIGNWVNLNKKYTIFIRINTYIFLICLVVRLIIISVISYFRLNGSQLMERHLRQKILIKLNIFRAFLFLSQFNFHLDS